MTGGAGEADRPLPVELARLLHDLRGPLNSAVMHLEVLKRTVAEDPTAADSLRTVLQQLVRLSEMLPAAFGVAALEPGRFDVFDLRTLVERARDARGLAGVRVAPGTWPRVRGDEALLVMAIGELLANAVEATPSGRSSPEASGASSPDGDGVLAVRDWGTGLRTTNPKLLIRLLHSTKTGHAGLGLVIAERVARVHGGTLAFEALADGARVTLRLPGDDAHASEPSRLR
jgi:signal transduction histidine kinase